MGKSILTRTMKTTNGRNGTITSDDRDFTLALAMPQEMGGKGDASKSNPEELFAAGYSACFASSMQYILQSENIEHGDFYAKAVCELSKDEDNNGFKFSVVMEADIEGLQKSQKQDVVDKAYRFCPYSRAIHGNVDVELVVK